MYFAKNTQLELNMVIKARFKLLYETRPFSVYSSFEGI